MQTGAAPVSAEAEISPRAARAYAYTGGIASNHTLHYARLSDFAWWFGPSAYGRIRSSVSVDTGSLLDTAEVLAQDMGFDIAHSLAVHYDTQRPAAFREVARDQAGGPLDSLYLPRPTQNIELMQTAQGVSYLTLMAAAYPAPIMWNPGERVTAQQAIEYVFTLWDEEGSWPWWAWEPVPDLRTLTTAQLAPGEYGPEDGLIHMRGLILPQREPHRRSMLEIIQDLLSPFPGTTYRINEDGRFEIIPVYGPDADAQPVVSLQPRDVVTLTEGKPDLLGLTNRWTVTAQGTGVVPDAGVMEPAWFQVGHPSAFGTAWWYDPPAGRTNLQPARNTPQQEHLSPGGPNALQWPAGWAVGEDQLPASDAGIELIDSAGVFQISHAWMLRRAGVLHDSGNDGLYVWHAGAGEWRPVSASNAPARLTIPYTGERVPVMRVAPPDWPRLSVEIRARYDAASGTVRFTFFADELRHRAFNSWVYLLFVEFTLNDATDAIQEMRAGTSVTFGVVENGDTLPTPAGGNAIAESQARYGVREKTLNIRGYDLPPAEAVAALTQIATGGVLRGITPRVIRSADLTIVGSTAARFAHVGRLVHLPTGEQGIMTGRQYADSYMPPTLVQAEVQVEVPDPTGVGAVAPDTRGLFTHPDGRFFTHPDGSFFDHPPL